MIFCILLCLSVALIIILKRIQNGVKENYWKKRNIVEVKSTLWEFMKGNQSLPEMYKEIYEQYPNEKYIGTYLGKSPALLLKNLEDIQAVLAGDFQSFYSRGVVVNSNDILADNVLFMENYKRWKLVRQKLSPVFTSFRLKTMFYIIDKCARDFVEVMEDSSRLRSNPFNTLYTYTTASIAASIFGIDTQTDNTMDSPYLDMARRALQPTFKLNLSFLLANTYPRLFKWLKLKFFGEHEKFFIGAVKKVLVDRRKRNERRNDFIEICLGLQRHGSMYDLTTGYELSPTDELLAAQAFFFFIAGTDTSANVMHFTLLELSSNPDILAKLHTEIDRIIGEKDEITYNEIERMFYLDMVISEAMRKYPTIGVLQRRCTKDTVLPGNVKIEKDCLVIVPVYAIHRDKKYYPNPEIFDPERFALDKKSHITKYSYMAFGEGNRNCLGARFARLQVKAGLAWLLRRFTLGKQNYKPERFEKSNFSLRDSNATYDLIVRDI